MGEGWKAAAACRGQAAAMFPVDADGEAVAVAICRACPVIDDCRAYFATLPGATEGVWFATTERQRSGRRPRRKAPA